jgi:hypothetical protein
MSTSTSSTPASRSRASVAAQAARCTSSPKNSGRDGTDSRPCGARHPASPIASRAASREYGSSASKPRAASSTRRAPARSCAKIDTQSSERHAGTTPHVDSRPRVGLTPTSALSVAGTRPEPAVSVPSENSTSPRATATAEPLLEPPDT